MFCLHTTHIHLSSLTNNTILNKLSENSTHKDHGASSLPETEVLKPVLLGLVLAESLFESWPVLRVAVRGTRGQRGTRAREGWLRRKGLQSLLSLLISLSAREGEMMEWNRINIRMAFRGTEVGLVEQIKKDSKLKRLQKCPKDIRKSLNIHVDWFMWWY